MTKIKICGITRAEDAELAAELGADFIGFVFVKESPRYVEPESVAAAVLGRRDGRGRPSLHRTVGVFRDASIDEIRRTAEIAQLDIIQLHGNESEDFVRAIELPTIRAFTITGAIPESSADWLMFDSGGGTGRTFDWSLLADYKRTKPFFLAGGLRPDNVEDAIRIVKPDAVDVSSGVESAPGIKDPRKLRDLFERVRRT